MEHTKGKVKIQNDLRIKNESNQIICDFYSFSEGIANKEAIANAKLTTDAFNTTNESGLTPSQLYKQNQELLDALKPFASLSRYYKNTGDKYVIHAWDTNEFGFSSLTVGMLHKAQKAINNAKTK